VIAPATSLADGPLDQSVIADNSAGGTVVALSRVAAVRGPGHSDASPSNLARANAHDCATPCQAIAASLQIVLVPAGSTAQAPVNVALATNVNCTGCGSFAFAYQYVVDVSRDVSLSGHARSQIAALRAEAARDVRAGLPYPTLDADLKDLATRLRAAVDQDLARQHVGEDHRHSNESVKQHPTE
jgi:hypothetical protein